MIPHKRISRTGKMVNNVHKDAEKISIAMNKYIGVVCIAVLVLLTILEATF